MSGGSLPEISLLRSVAEHGREAGERVQEVAGNMQPRTPTIVRARCFVEIAIV